MFCSQCGSEQTEMGAYCSSCGLASDRASAGMSARPPTESRPVVVPSYRPGPITHQAPTPSTPGSGFSTAGIIFGAIAFLFFPIVLGPAGLILGAIAKSKGEEKAIIAIVVSAVGMVVGFIFGAIVWSSV